MEKNISSCPRALVFFKPYFKNYVLNEMSPTPTSVWSFKRLPHENRLQHWVFLVSMYHPAYLLPCLFCSVLGSPQNANFMSSISVISVVSACKANSIAWHLQKSTVTEKTDVRGNTKITFWGWGYISVIGESICLTPQKGPPSPAVNNLKQTNTKLYLLDFPNNYTHRIVLSVSSSNTKLSKCCSLCSQPFR